MPPIRILIVEDESIVAKDIQHRLENLGYIVLSIVDAGEVAIKKTEQMRPDLVLMDIRLKGTMDGIDASKQIRNRYNIPVVYLTAYADNSTLERAKITEPFGYIVKPVEDSELKASIVLALYKHAVENKLKISEEKFRIIFENANDVIVYIDKQGKIVDANKKIEEVFGYKPEEVKGKNFLELKLFEQKKLPRVIKRFRDTIEKREFLNLVELEVFDKKGNKITIEASSTCIQKDGKIEGYLNIVRDITQRKTVEEALKNEQKRIKELTKKIINAQEEERLYLASEIHDDLLQSLVAVLYFFQMIDLSSLDKKTKEQKEKLVEIIRSSIGRCRALISDIEPLREPKMGLIQAIKESIDQKFINSKIKVDFNYPKKFPKIDLLIKTNVLRIIQEALMNVRKHAKATEVSVKISTSKGELKTEVKDDGLGFNPKTVSKKVTNHYGLLTMAERARLVGGKLTISSRLGKGTIIKAILPLHGG